MSQSLCQNYLHVVFSTKNRQPFLPELEVREDMFSYLAGTCRNLNSPALQVGGMPDHVHLLCRLSKNLSVADLVRELKRESSKWAKSHARNFSWQKGYGAFSISPAHIAALRKYIVSQENHHRRTTFQEEFRRLCEKYDVAIDERYCWD